jgi:hypothetical protein
MDFSAMHVCTTAPSSQFRPKQRYCCRCRSWSTYRSPPSGVRCLCCRRKGNFFCSSWARRQTSSLSPHIFISDATLRHVFFYFAPMGELLSPRGELWHPGAKLGHRGKLLTPGANFDPQGWSWATGVNFCPQGRSWAPGVNFDSQGWSWAPGAKSGPRGELWLPGVKLGPRGEVGPQGWTLSPVAKLGPRAEPCSKGVKLFH